MAWSITRSGVEIREERYTSNAEEADTRVWLHVREAQGKCKLVYSPDTDVYHIGLTTADLQSNEVIVLLTPVGREMKLLHLNQLVDALESDLDLQCLPTEQIKGIIQVMYVLSGCDFTSFFYGLSKNSFLKTLFENSAFISTSCMHGTAWFTGRCEARWKWILGLFKPHGGAWYTSASMVRHLKTVLHKDCLTHLLKDKWKRNTSSGTMPFVMQCGKGFP